MRLHPALLSFVVSLLAAASLAAQTPARIVYTFEHPQLQPSRYTITLEENGAAHFVSQAGVTQQDDDVFPAPIDRSIRIDESLRSSLFQYARTHSFFATNCDRHQGNLAFTGHRTLTYTGPDGQGSCAFIWAADPTLQRLTDDLGAVALTIEFGRRLNVEVQHDRLGLDAELESLQDAVKSRRASDLPNIAEQLQTIAEDQQVMERARKRALALLSRCENPQKSN
ncbi:MAG TPA: hypothetical protein VHX13_09290 [Acidobacteriaceae bacterium]|jgi:hypothetical protein|nr:hypothetical protein [Acidobacteriaceae bacterium]